MRHGFDRVVVIGILLLALVLAGVTAVSYANTRAIQNGAARADHSQELIEVIATVRTDVRKLQAGQRGYIISGIESWLQPFDEATAALRTHSERLSALAADDPDQRQRAEAVGREIGTGLAGLNEMVALRRAKGYEAILEVSRARGIRSFVDPLLDTLDAMDRHERARLEVRKAEARQAYTSAIVYEAVVWVLGMISLGLFGWALVRSARARARDAVHLADQRELLNATLTSIGDAVIATDDTGRVTFLNAVAEKLTGWSQADAVGLPLDRMFHIVNESTRKPVENPAHRALREGVVVGLANHTVLIAKDGTEHPIDDSAAPIRARGVVRGAVLVFRDITERHEAARERERLLGEVDAERRLLDAVFDALPVGAVVAEPGGRLVKMNRANLNLWGAAPPTDSIAEYRTWAGWWPDTGKRVEPEEWALSRVLTTGASVPGDRVVIEPFNGGRRTVIISGAPVRDAAGQLVAGVTALLDVTEQERLLRQVDEERRRLAEVFRHAPSFMGVLLGPDHVFQLANDRYLELVGGRDMIGLPVREALPEVAGQGYFELLDEVFRTGRPHVGAGNRVVLVRDGVLEERFVDFVYQPVRDADGAVSGIIVQGIDITQRRRAEDGLVRVTAESERLRRLYETVLSATPDFVYVFGLDHKVQYANESLLKMWGRDTEGAVGKTFLELGYEPWHAEMHGREIDQVRATKKPIRGEVPFNGTLGRRIYDYIFVPVFGPDGTVEAVAGTTRDVTERQRSEEALRQLAADLSEADRRKDEFLATLAHELRNPLAPVRNGVEILKVSAAPEPRLERTLGMMERQLAHMVHLVDDLMDVSRVSRGKVALRKERVELRAIAESAIESTRPMIEASGHELEVRLPEEPLVFDADKTRLAQVLTNLLNNAAKYTTRGGRITLSAERAGTAAVIRVSDTGVGIPADMLHKVFEMFTQVGASMDRAQGGLGIGLTLVKRLVEMHGGTVVADSAGPGLGSEFTVRLPAASAHAVRTTARDGGERPPGRRILVVDDNEDGAESLAEMLRLLGNEVETAHDGMAAVERAERFRPEVILMDLGMPKLNGLEATRRIRGYEWGTGMTIIAQTGWGQSTDRDRSREAGCDGHLVKPVNLTELEKLLAELKARPN